MYFIFRRRKFSSVKRRTMGDGRFWLGVFALLGLLVNGGDLDILSVLVGFARVRDERPLAIGLLSCLSSPL
jgi:hypothetical protein